MAQARQNGNPILYQNGDYTVRRERRGRRELYAIYRDGATAAARMANVDIFLGLDYATREADRFAESDRKLIRRSAE